MPTSARSSDTFIARALKIAGDDANASHTYFSRDCNGEQDMIFRQPGWALMALVPYGAPYPILDDCLQICRHPQRRREDDLQGAILLRISRDDYIMVR